MSTLRTGAIAALLFCAGAGAQASEITVSTGKSDAMNLATPQDYQAVVEAAIATPTDGYGSTKVDVFDGVSNHVTLSGPTTSVAYKFEVKFFVADANAGPWMFRGGVDFGGGGVMMLDGVPLEFYASDMWWAGSYGNPNAFLEGGADLLAGEHTLVFYGLENCCDGGAIGQQAQFRIGDGQYTTFSIYDGLAAPIPEPSRVGMLLGGLGLLAALGCRSDRKAGHARPAPSMR